MSSVRDRYERKEFGTVNLDVEISGNAVKIWACSLKGMNVFRLKTIGKVHAADISSIVVMSNPELTNRIVKYLESKVSDLPKDYEYRNLRELAETILSNVKLIVGSE